MPARKKKIIVFNCLMGKKLEDHERDSLFRFATPVDETRLRAMSLVDAGFGYLRASIGILIFFFRAKAIASSYPASA
jgi:hypothetical protein